MSKTSKRRPARSERRAAERRSEREIADRLKLAALEVGGAPDRPIVVESASLVEPTAASMPCARCGERVRVEEHAARSIAGVSLRVVTVRCPTCGHSRAVHFRVVVASPN